MRRVLGTLILVMLLLMVACAGPKEPTPTPLVKATMTAPKPASIPTTVQPTAEAEEYNFGQATGLAGLNSYRMHYTFKWETMKAGQKETGSWDVLEERVNQPLARRLVWTSTSAEETSTLEVIQLGQDSYYINTGSGWLAMTTYGEDLFGGNRFLSDPFGVISGNRGKLMQRNVLVNGVPTNRYVFDESTLGSAVGLGVIAKASGEVWVSTEFNVVVKYTAHYEGKNLAIGGGDEGAFDTTFDLTDINKPITIEAPEGVKPAMPVDIPIIDGATELSAISGFISFKTTKSVEEVSAFYATQMPANGWNKGEEAIPGMMSFTKDGRTAQIMIQVEEGKTMVVIMTGEE
nr:hypothetical protein [Chloroflexota bacterium]